MWRSKINQEHPLLGKIWRAADDRFVSVSQLQNAIETSKYILIGEKHDNPDHHQIERLILDYRLNHMQTSVRPTVILEMLDRKQMAGVNQQRLKNVHSVVELRELLHWRDESWPWNNYREVIRTALNSGATLAAGNIDRPSLFAAAKSGLENLDSELRQASTTMIKMSNTMRAAVLEDVFEGHCQLMPKEHMGSMVTIQQMRDAYMAFRLFKSGQSILIAGNGHIRNDYAVGWHLAQRDKNSEIVSIALLEVQMGETNPGKYVEPLNDVTEVYDYIWFTPKFSDEDKCVKLKKHLQRKDSDTHSTPSLSPD